MPGKDLLMGRVREGAEGANRRAMLRSWAWERSVESCDLILSGLLEEEDMLNRLESEQPHFATPGGQAVG